VKRLVAALLLAVAATASAQQQVGYAPAHSPYRDVEQTMEMSLLAGHFSAGSDPAGVAPQSASIWTLLYGWHATGPLFLNASLAQTTSSRHVIDPTALVRDRGMAYWPLYALDGTMALSLTGDRTFHGFMPLVNAGMGFITDRHSQSDVGDFQFGSRFELVYGATLRYVASSRWAVRADLTNRLYSMGYPETYYAAGKIGTPVVASTFSKSFWRNNPSFSIGISYLFSH
jgi:hypothetical protein